MIAPAHRPAVQPRSARASHVRDEHGRCAAHGLEYCAPCDQALSDYLDEFRAPRFGDDDHDPGFGELSDRVSW